MGLQIDNIGIENINDALSVFSPEEYRGVLIEFFPDNIDEVMKVIEEVTSTGRKEVTLDDFETVDDSCNTIRKSIFAVIDEIYPLQLKRAALWYHDFLGMNIFPIEFKDTIKESDKIIKKELKEEKGYYCVGVNDDQYGTDYYNNYFEGPFYDIFDMKDSSENNTFKIPTTNKSDNLFDYNWGKDSGLGVFLGHDNIWALDIYGIDFLELRYKPFLSQTLELLHLPSNYEWVVHNESRKELHIIFRAQAYNDELRNNDIVFSGKRPIHCEGKPFDYIELRTKAFLVLPPSKQLPYGRYEFFFKEEPKKKPLFISMDQLYSFLSFNFGYPEELNIGRSSLSREALVNKVEYLDNTYSNGPNMALYIRDEIPLLRSCTNDEALNSLGFVYARLAGESKDGGSYYKLAEKCFKNSMSKRAKDNLQVLHSLELTSFFNYNDDIEEVSEKLVSLGKHKCTYLKRHNYKYLFFDTETTGVPKRKDASWEDSENWPRLVQIAYLLADSSGREIASFDYIIRPEGFIIPEESINVHGIDNWEARRSGKDCEEVLEEFIDLVDMADAIVGHNIDFDINVLGSEIARHYYVLYRGWWDGLNKFNPEDMLINKRRICTMKSSVNYCKFPSNNGYGYRYPKLQELYKYLFGQSFDGAHNALADIKATYQCFVELVKRGVLDIKFPL